MAERPTAEDLALWQRLADAATSASEYGHYGAAVGYTALSMAGDSFAEFERAEDAEFYIAACTAVPVLLAALDEYKQGWAESGFALAESLIERALLTSRLATLIPLARAAVAFINAHDGGLEWLVGGDDVATAVAELPDDLRSELEVSS